MTRYDFGLFVLDRYRSSGLVVTVYLDAFVAHLIASAVLASIDDVIEAHRAMWRLVAAKYGIPERTVQFDTLPAQVADAIREQRKADATLTIPKLVRKNLLDASPDLRALVAAGLAQGFGAAVIADQIATILGGDTPGAMPDGISAVALRDSPLGDLAVHPLPES